MSWLCDVCCLLFASHGDGTRAKKEGRNLNLSEQISLSKYIINFDCYFIFMSNFFIRFQSQLLFVGFVWLFFLFLVTFIRCFLFSTSGGVWEAEISYPSIYDSRFAVGVISDVRLLQRIYASQIFHFLHGWWIKSHLTKHKSTTLTYWELRWNKNRLVVASSESARERRAIVKKCWS